MTKPISQAVRVSWLNHHIHVLYISLTVRWLLISWRTMVGGGEIKRYNTTDIGSHYHCIQIVIKWRCYQKLRQIDINLMFMIGFVLLLIVKLFHRHHEAMPKAWPSWRWWEISTVRRSFQSPRGMERSAQAHFRLGWLKRWYLSPKRIKRA